MRLLPALALPLLGGCLINTELRDERLADLDGCDKPATWYPDADGDGQGVTEAGVEACEPPEGHVAEPGDCDDEASNVFTGANERCDGVDNDCNGEIDDDPVDATTVFPDADGDTYGDDAGAITACDPPTGDGWTPVGGDCDDGEPAVNPGTQERCDGLDNDCNGVPDEPPPADAPVWYPDDDDDGFGDPNQPIPACDPPLDTLLDAQDCDDTRPLVNPLGVDITLQDRDCDGVNGDLSVADAEIHGQPGQFLGHSLAPVGDFDGDGLDDWLAGAPGSDPTLDPGTGWLVLGGTVSANAAMSAVGLPYEAEATGDLGGTSVGGGGDFDGDGMPDLVIGSPLQQFDRGSAYTVFGDPNPTATPLVYATEYRGDAQGDHTGTSVSLAGDLTGDGVADLVVGGPLSALSGPEAGIVYLVPGGGLGVRTSTWLYGFVELTGPTGSRAGTAVAHAGDVDGDGDGDLVVGGPLRSDGVGSPGGAWLIDGSAMLASGELETVATHIAVGEQDGDLAGTSVAGAGDVNGDGYDDVLVGAPGANGGNGRAYLVYGAPGGPPIIDLAQADVLFDGDAGSLAGWSVAGAGDVNGDGYADVLVGAPGTGSNGAALLQLGGPALPATLDPTTVSVMIHGELPGDAAGSAVAGVGDVDGDGFDDVVIGGSEHAHAGVPDTGAAYLLFGLDL